MFQFNIQKWILLSLMLSSVVARAGLEDNTDAAAASCSSFYPFPSSRPAVFSQEETDAMLMFIREVPTIGGYIQWTTIECLYNQWAREQKPIRPMKTAKMLKEHYENNLQKRQRSALSSEEEIRHLFDLMLNGYLKEEKQFKVPWSKWANEEFPGRTDIDLKKIYAVEEFYKRLREFFITQAKQSKPAMIQFFLDLLEAIDEELKAVVNELSEIERNRRADAQYRRYIMRGVRGGPGIPNEVLMAREPIFGEPPPLELPRDLWLPLPPPPSPPLPPLQPSSH